MWQTHVLKKCSEEPTHSYGENCQCSFIVITVTSSWGWSQKPSSELRFVIKFFGCSEDKHVAPHNMCSSRQTSDCWWLTAQTTVTRWQFSHKSLEKLNVAKLEFYWVSCAFISNWKLWLVRMFCRKSVCDDFWHGRNWWGTRGTCPPTFSS